MGTSPVFGDTPVRPPFDPEVEVVYNAFLETYQPLGPDTLDEIRRAADEAPRPDLTAGGKVVVTERRIPGPEGAPDLNVTILSPPSGATGLPGIYYIHGGGLVMGNRYMYLEEFLPYVANSQAVVVSVGYRFAPEYQAPAQVEDCYAGLTWMALNAAELGIDPDRIITMGVSAGGGLALGTALMARDCGFPMITHQILVAPMVDDRFDLPSTRMLDGGQPTDRNDCLYFWTVALGDKHGGLDVSHYVAPARAEDLAGLPRTYIDFGDVEGFRDQLLTLALRLSQAGVSVDAHMWGGGFHGFYYVAPDAAMSRAARATRDEFIARALGGSTVACPERRD